MVSTVCCHLCMSNKSALVYQIKNMPVFQNKVYRSKRLAHHVVTSDVSLQCCEDCGFVFNSSFDAQHMIYDTYYENEQSYSTFFQQYLTNILEIFTQHSFQNKKMIEIGCGKGFFFELLTKHGFKVTGFDPAYTGDNPNIIKDYFDQKYSTLSGEVIVLRHVLEHIAQPLDFLHSIALAVNYDATIYIEVPALEWIIQQHAFWDIFHEHCNYFSATSLGGLFKHSEQGYLFNGQYLYLIADLKDLRQKSENSQQQPLAFTQLNRRIDQYRANITHRTDTIVWGAGAKGVTFCNVVDPDAKHIRYLIDINPKKQQYYIGKSAHQILSPQDLESEPPGSILVMNDNYFDEIRLMIPSSKFKMLRLSDFI